MGIYSNKFIQREEAINIILENINKASNTQIAEMLCDLIGEKTFNNFIVFNKYDNDILYPEIDEFDKSVLET